MSLAYEDLLGVGFKYGGRSKEEGFDCWGLCMELSKRAGIYLPEFPHPTEYESIDKVMSKGTEQFTLLDKPEPFSIATFMIIPPYVSHAGIVMEDGSFVHIMEQSSVTKERLDAHIWTRRIKGFYKYEQ